MSENEDQERGIKRINIKGKYACKVCKGTGVDACCECGNDVGCEWCGSTGIDSDFVDIARFRLAEVTSRLRCAGLSWALIEDGEWVGRAGGKQAGRVEFRLYYRDFPAG